MLRRGCKIHDENLKFGESCPAVTGLCTGEITLFFDIVQQFGESCPAVTCVCTGEVTLFSDIVRQLCESCFGLVLALAPQHEILQLPDWNAG